MEKYARNVRTLKTPFPANILYKDIVGVVTNPDLTIRILEMYGVKTIKDVTILQHENFKEERIGLFRVKKSELSNWFAAFNHMEMHPPTEHYLEVCDKLDQMLADYEEEMNK